MDGETNLEKRVRSIETVQAAQRACYRAVDHAVDDHEARLRSIEELAPLLKINQFILMALGASMIALIWALLTGQVELRNQMIRQVFGRYLTDEVVEGLLENPEGLRFGGEKRRISVLFADLRGFTTLAEKLPPEKVVTLINGFLAVMSEVIIDFGGTIDEFLGDAILAVFGAPLGERANPGMSPNPAKAPWFFIGMQEMLLHVHPVFSVLVIPLLMLGWLLLLPYLMDNPNGGGVWFYSAKGRRMGVVSVLFAIVFSTAGILGDEYVFDLAGTLEAMPTVISSGLLPLSVFSGATAVFLIFLKRRYSADSHEVLQSLYILLMTVYVVLTITCLWFRGVNMALAWPWP